MSQSIALPPVHDTSPPPFDDDVDEDDFNPPIGIDQFVETTSADVLNNSNDDDWKSVDDNNDTNAAQIEEDTAIVNDEDTSTKVTPAIEEDWANFATFENNTEELLEVRILQSSFNVLLGNSIDFLKTAPTTASPVIEEKNEADWANFESNTVPPSEEPILSSNDQPPESIAEQDDDDDDFGDFNEVTVAPQPPPPPTSSLPTVCSFAIFSLHNPSSFRKL